MQRSRSGKLLPDPQCDDSRVDRRSSRTAREEAAALTANIHSQPSIFMSSCCNKPESEGGEPVKQTGPVRHYPLDTCIVSDARLGGHGEPYVFVHDGQEIKLCCEGCLPKFQAEPAKYLVKLPSDEKADES